MPALPLLALLALAAPPGDAEAALRALCQTHASDPANPWALAHGITALGPGFRARDGRLAAEVILHDFLKRPEGAPAFERYTPDGTPVDPHPNLLIKTLALAPVPPDKAFRTPSGEVTLRALLTGVERSLRPPDGEADRRWAELAWTLDALSAAHVPGTRFRNDRGEEIDLDRLMEAALAALERAQAELGEALDAGRPQVDKRKQGIYAHPCGGLHFFQAVAGWARHPAIRERWSRRLGRQVDILFYRLSSESRQYEAALRELPQHRLRVLAQMLKFEGHLLETFGRLRDERVLTPTPRQKEEIARARLRLARTVGEIQRLGAFQRLEQLRREQPQLYLDLVGDACHALRGLRSWS